MESNRTKMRFSLAPSEAATLLLVVVLFLPAFTSLRSLGSAVAYDINSLMWRVVFYRDGPIAIGFDSYAIGILPYIFLKYLLVLQIYRYYRHQTTRTRVLILGILSEIQMFVMIEVPVFIGIILGNVPWSSLDWIIPIPFVLVTCILLLVFAPPPDSEPMWVEQQEENQWWDKSNKKDSP